MQVDPQKDVEMVAPSIDKELIQDVLRRHEGHQLEVLDYKVTAATSAGENMLSVLLAVSVETKLPDGSSKQQRLIVKSAFYDDVRSKMCKDVLAFEKEELMYSEIFPAMIEHQKTKNGGKTTMVMTLSTPDLLACIHRDGLPDLIIMSDLRQLGYKPVKAMDMDHFYMVMKELARFHALGYLLKQKRGLACLREDFPNLFVNTYQELLVFFKDIIALVTNATAETIRAVGDDLVSKVESFLKVDYVALANRCSAIVEPYATICHKDCSLRNLMFKYDEHAGVPSSVKLLDFQTVQYANPTSDLAYVIYTGSECCIDEDVTLRLVRTYYECLTRDMKQLGVNCEFSFESFHELFIQTRQYALISGMMVRCFAVLMESKCADPKELSQILVRNGSASIILDWFRLLAKDGLF